MILFLQNDKVDQIYVDGTILYNRVAYDDGFVFSCDSDNRHSR